MNLNWEFITSVLQIVVIDVVLSGDNAVVIAMAAHRLPVRQRRAAILFGAGAAIVLRVLCTYVLARLLGVPFLRFAGGLVLVWIAMKLIMEDDEGDHKVREAGGLFQAVWIIIMADFVMSLDNMLAVGGASEGNALLILFGLVLSIAIIMTSSAIITEWMNRFPILVLLGAVVLAWTAAEMMIEDEKVAELSVSRWQLCVNAGWHKEFGPPPSEEDSKSWWHGAHGGKEKKAKPWWLEAEATLVHRHGIGWAGVLGVCGLVIAAPRVRNAIRGRRRDDDAADSAAPAPDAKSPGPPDAGGLGQTTA